MTNSNKSKKFQELTNEETVFNSLEKDGFYGITFSPAENKYPKKAIIVFTGSDGSFKLACTMGRYFSNIGITCISLAYWKIKGLPNEFVSVPLESIENAVSLLKKDGFEKIGVCGISKGGELSLLAGSILSNINGVISISPMHISCMGFKGMKEVDRSSWSYKGEDIPYSKGHMDIRKVIKKSILQKEPTMNFIYEDLVSTYNPESIIKVENINGPILLISSDYDSMWPSKLSCQKVIERLEKMNFKYKYEHLNYKYASHMIFPVKGLWNSLFQVERKFKNECEESRIDLDKNFKDWINIW